MALGVLTQAVALCVGLAWPVVVFVLVLVVILVFRKQIPQVLSRVSEFAFPGGRVVLKWGEASVDRPPEFAAPVPPVSVGPEEGVAGEAVDEAERPAEAAIKWENTGSLFWLGVDLIWAMDLVLRDAPADAIGYLLEHLLSYIRAMGFPSTEVGAAIERNLAEIMIAYAVEEEWTAERRNSYASFFLKAAKDIGRLATDNQREHGGWPE